MAKTLQLKRGTTTQNIAFTGLAGEVTVDTDKKTLVVHDGVTVGGNVIQHVEAYPLITSVVYSGGASATAEDALSTTAVMLVNGVNFESTNAGDAAIATVTIGGTAPTAISINAARTLATVTVPSKTAGTHELKVLNTSTGYFDTLNVEFSADPAWTTATGNILTTNVADSTAFTNSSSPLARIVATEASDTIDYAQVTGASDDTVITSGVAGLTLGTTGANAGYLTGSLGGSVGNTYNFYAQATDDEGQKSGIRLFNIIRSYDGVGGVTTTYTGYVVHTFLLANTGQTFTPLVGMDVDWLVVAGGGGGGGEAGGGGGAGGFRTGTSYSLTADTAYTITVGAGGSGITADGSPRAGLPGGDSVFGSYTSTGGGAGLGQDALNQAGGTAVPSGGSGGGAQAWGSVTVHTGISGQGYDGGAGSGGENQGGGYVGPAYGSGGGGGASAAGADGTGSAGGAGGSGTANYYRDGDSSGTTNGIHRFAGGGRGGSNISTVDAGSYGGGGDNGTGHDGVANSGSGGGGSASHGSDYSGNGGSGIVVIRYAV